MMNMPTNAVAEKRPERSWHCLLLTSLDVNVYGHQCLIHLIARLAPDQLVTQIVQNKGLFNRN